MGATLIPYRGDSTVFPDMESMSLLVFDARAQSSRSWAPPNASALMTLIGNLSAFDNKGRLLYTDRLGAPGDSTWRDSAALVRADLDARRVDTVARVHRPSAFASTFTAMVDGVRKQTLVLNPLINVDDWSVLADGTIALVRGHDYHVEWIHPDGTMSATAKLPFDWKRLSDDDKQRLLDSTRKIVDARAAATQSPAGTAARGGGGGSADGGGRGSADGGGRGSGGGEPRPQTRTVVTTEYVPLNQIADYYPPIRAGAAKADLDGNLWILPTTSAQSKNGELVYDLLNPKNGLVERVRIPLGRSIAGFGKGGVVYLLAGDRTNGFYLERTQLPRMK
jgi:hypothetical protein